MVSLYKNLRLNFFVLTAELLLVGGRNTVGGERHAI